MHARTHESMRIHGHAANHIKRVNELAHASSGACALMLLIFEALSCPSLPPSVPPSLLPSVPPSHPPTDQFLQVAAEVLVAQLPRAVHVFTD